MDHDASIPGSRADGRPAAEPTTRRRALLGAVGTAALGGTLPRVVGRQTAPGVVLRQADRCVPVSPLRGDQSVASLYDYRLAETRYSAAGATHLQRADGSVLFLYDGPGGRSLVAIHGKLGGSGDGGSATFAIDGLPAAGEWVVRDDDYPGESNHDRWDLGGGTHRIDWTWAGARTDGGAFRGLGGDFSVTVTPAFDEAAALYGEFYDGRVDTWEFLAGDLADPERIGLRTDRPVTVETGTCEDRTSTTTTTTRTTTRRSTTTDGTDDRDVDDDDDEREDDDDDEREDDDDDEHEDEEADEREDDEDEADGGPAAAHEKRAETFEEKAERAREKGERRAEKFEEKAEEHDGTAAEKFAEKAERAREKGERKAEMFEEKAERAREKAEQTREMVRGNPGRGPPDGTEGNPGRGPPDGAEGKPGRGPPDGAEGNPGRGPPDEDEEEAEDEQDDD